MKTAISIPDDLHRAAERAAKRLGLSRSELYRRALGEYLSQHADKIVTDALNEIYDGETSQPGIGPALMDAQLSSLPADEW